MASSFAREKFLWLDQVRRDPELTPLACHRELSDRYQERLCALIPGAQITRGLVHRVVKASGQRIEALDLLADDTRRDGWIAAIVAFMEEVNAIDATG
jgi:hypothetical protein